MFRMLFVMVTTVLIGLGSGYFLWGTRVARMTESLSGLTLELDTMRARAAAPKEEVATEGSVKAADELRVINESLAALRVEVGEQKALIQSTATAASPTDAAATAAELRTVRNDLAACIADKQDLEVRCAAAAAPAPSPVPQPYQPRPAYPPLR